MLSWARKLDRFPGQIRVGGMRFSNAPCFSKKLFIYDKGRGQFCQQKTPQRAYCICRRLTGVWEVDLPEPGVWRIPKRSIAREDGRANFDARRLVEMFLYRAKVGHFDDRLPVFLRKTWRQLNLDFNLSDHFLL